MFILIAIHLSLHTSQTKKSTNKQHSSGAYLPFNASDIARLPALTFALPNGPTLTLEAEDYLFQVTTDPVTGLPLRTLGLQPFIGKNFFILGQVLTRKFYTEFDAEGARIGFAPAVPDCYKAAGV